MSDVGVVLFVVIALTIYFLPSFVAAGRQNNGGVLIVNLFLGWTLIGWVVALAWAASLSRDDAKPETVGPSGELVAAPPSVSNTRTCPFCAEDIKLEAIVCKHCGRDVPRARPAAFAEEASPPAAIP